MLLKCFNGALVNDREKTYLTVAVAAAATSLTVTSTNLAPAATSSDTWADNDYMIIGEIGQEGTEVMQVNGAITTATGITIDREGQAGGTRYAHSVGTPVYRVDFNRVEFSQNTTDTTSGVSILTTIRIQPDDEFTRYQDVTNTTGYGFARFNNQTTGAFSSYSDGVNYEASGQSSSRDPRTLWTMKKKVRQILDENESSKLTDDMITDTLNDKQREIAHMRLWSFYENERSFSIVANQFAYDIPSTVQIIHGIRFDTQPLIYINKAEWDIQHWDTNANTTNPIYFTIWNRQILISPCPSASSSTTALNGGITSTDTTATVTATSAFNRGDYYRFIIDSEVIYATNSTSTTFTGLLRGREGTTAASHTDTTTVTERDIVYTCHAEPIDLIDTQDRTDIPEPDVLTYGAAADLAPFVGKSSLLPTFETKYKTRVEELKAKYSSKQTMQFGRIKDMSERIQNSTQLANPNLYPRNITE